MFDKIESAKNRVHAHLQTHKLKYGLAVGTIAGLRVGAWIHEGYEDEVRVFVAEHDLTDQFNSYMEEVLVNP